MAPSETYQEHRHGGTGWGNAPEQDPISREEGLRRQLARVSDIEVAVKFWPEDYWVQWRDCITGSV